GSSIKMLTVRFCFIYLTPSFLARSRISISSIAVRFTPHFSASFSNRSFPSEERRKLVGPLDIVLVDCVSTSYYQCSYFVLTTQVQVIHEKRDASRSRRPWYSSPSRIWKGSDR